MELNDFILESIPTAILGKHNPVGFEVNYLGNDVLKRYNILLDFKHDKIYLKPNKYLGLPFREVKT